MTGPFLDGVGGRRDADAAADFRILCDRLHGWVRACLDLCGGWLPELDAMYTPRTFGCYRFAPEVSTMLRQVAAGLGGLYARLGRQIQARLAAARLDDRWPLDRFSPDERQFLNEARAPHAWATTLRADVILENGNPQIVEVNSDNVGGLEDLAMFLSFYREDGPPDFRDPARQAYRALTDAFYAWVEAHYQAFATAAGAPDLKDTTIALVAEDRSNSYALIRVLAALLADKGYRVQCCRPEHLSYEGATLQVGGPLGGAPRPVSLVLKHWLFFEVFDEADRPFPRFDALRKAAAERKVLVLNPFSERLLFSKAILAELKTRRHGLFDLTQEDQAFVDRYVPETDFAEPVGADQVLKPVSQFGGRGVTIGGTADQGLWVQQRRINGERLSLLYRADAAATPEPRDMYVVHGLVVYGFPDGTSRLAGVMTRLGPNPVVNFSRGAQIVPGLLH